MAHHPELLKAWWNFRKHSVHGGDLSKRKGELVILRVVVQMKTWYEWAAHVTRGLTCGLTRKEIKRVRLGDNTSGWDISETILLNAVDELIAHHYLSEKSHAKLREHYSVKQIMDIIAIHSMYIIIGCMVNTWDLELGLHVEDKLPAEFSKDDFEAQYK